MKGGFHVDKAKKFIDGPLFIDGVCFFQFGAGG
jgi:hypothetical protein